jgi:hypothetical protein
MQHNLGLDAEGIQLGDAAHANSSDIMHLMSSISATPEMSGLSAHVYEQMLQACQALDGKYPASGSAVISGSLPPPPTGQIGDFAARLRTIAANGAGNKDETRELGALALHGMLQKWPSSPADLLKLSHDMLWLECNSKLPILSLASNGLDASKRRELATALLKRSEGTDESGFACGERCLALTWSRALTADPACLNIVLASSGMGPRLPPGERLPDTLHVSPLMNSSADPIHGRLVAVPRGPLATAISAFTGWMLVRQLLAWTLRFTLAYRARAEVRLSERGLEVHERKTLLGRPLRDRTSLIALHAVRRMSREVRYARAGTYAGLAALAIGSFVGMRLFIDGLRAPGFSGPTLLMGLMVVLAGLGLDFVLANWLDSSRGQCRLVIEIARGRGLCLSCDEPTKVDGILVQLAQKLGD